MFRAELRSAQQALNVPQGRVYQALCDAALGDARCGVDLEDPAFRGDGDGGGGARPAIGWRWTGLDGFAEGWFALGRGALERRARASGLRDRW